MQLFSGGWKTHKPDAIRFIRWQIFSPFILDHFSLSSFFFLSFVTRRLRKMTGPTQFFFDNTRACNECRWADDSSFSKKKGTVDKWIKKKGQKRNDHRSFANDRADCRWSSCTRRCLYGQRTLKGEEKKLLSITVNYNTRNTQTLEGLI